MFQSTILILPGIGGSGTQHWQSLWEKQYGFTRVEQRDWETPDCNEWINVLNQSIQKYDPADVIIVAHSAACIMVAQWAKQYPLQIKGALLVAPADADGATFPEGARGFTPVPLTKLPFPSIVVASANDHFADIDRSLQFANAWGSSFVNVGNAGHINVASGYGEWDAGLPFLKQLDQVK